MSRTIDKCILHHSLTPRDMELERAVASFNRTHKERLHPTPNSLGYFIGYHYVIAYDGRRLKTRGLDEIGYHAGNREANKTSVGICFVGNFDTEKPTKHQILTFQYLLGELEAKYPDIQVHFHNEYSSKSCPGKNLTRDLLLKKEGMKITDYTIPDRDGIIYRHLHSPPDDLDKYRSLIMVNNGLSIWSPYIGKGFMMTKYSSWSHLDIYRGDTKEFPIEFPKNGLAKGGFGKIFYNQEKPRRNDGKFRFMTGHEAGHSFGFGHCNNKGCLMNGNYDDIDKVNPHLCDYHIEEAKAKYLYT